MLVYRTWKSNGDISVANPAVNDGVCGYIDLRWYPGMAGDYRDVRFSSVEGIVLPYWIESYTGGSTARIWIRLPIHATKIRFYYGNGTAVSESSGTNTFLLFDDFFGSSPDTSKWTVLGSPSVSGGAITCSKGNEIVSKVSFDNCNVRVKINSMYSVSRSPFFTLTSSASSGAREYKYSFYGNYPVNNSVCAMRGTASGSSIGVDGSSAAIYGMVRVGSTCGFYLNDVLKSTLTGGSTSALYVQAAADSATPGASPISIDWLAVWYHPTAEPVLTLVSKRPSDTILHRITEFVLTEPQDGSGHIGLTPEYEAHQVIPVTGGQIGLSGHVYIRKEDISVVGEIWLHNSVRIKQFIQVNDNLDPDHMVRIQPVFPDVAYKTWESIDGPEIGIVAPVYIENKDYYDASANIAIDSEFIPCKDVYNINFLKDVHNWTFEIHSQAVQYPNSLDMGNLTNVIVSNPLTYMGDLYPVENKSLSIFPAGNTGRHFVAVPSPYHAGTDEDPLPRIRLQFSNEYQSTSHISPINARGLVIALPAFSWRYGLGISSAYVYIGYQAAILKKRILLVDYALVSADLKKSVTDFFWELTSEFSGTDFPREFTDVNHDVIDDDGITRHLFMGVSPNANPTMSCYDSRSSMVAYDYGWYLSTQYLPDDARVITLNDAHPTWQDWIYYLLQGTGILAYKIANVTTANKQFVFDAKTKKRDAIDAISDYCNCIFEVKWYNHNTEEEPEWYTAAYWVELDMLDDPDHGLDLPFPETFHWPDPCMNDKPEISINPEEKINRVRIRGCDSSGNYFTCVAETDELAAGEDIAREYYEESADYNTRELVDARATVMMDYFLHPPITVQAKFIKRYDLQLYQRIKFDGDFPDYLKEVTDGDHGEEWLRIIEIHYHSAPADEYVEIKAVNSKDLNLLLARSGYSSLDNVDETTKIVDSIIKDQVFPEIGTIAEVQGDDGARYAVVTTESGKTIISRIV